MSLWLLNDHHAVIWRLGGLVGDPPSPRGLVVGECPGPNTDPRTPMFPDVSHPNSSANRLMRLGRFTLQEYLGRLTCVNQCLHTWNEDEAVVRHRLMIKWLMSHGRCMRVLLLGAKVQSVWGVGNRRFGYERFADTLQITWAPHPSGMCRAYNEVKNREQLARRVRWVAGLSP